jgi:hypothetical protein
LRFSGLILENISVVFLGSSCRETAKNAIKKLDGEMRQEKAFSPLTSQLFRPKVVDTDFPKKVLGGVFELNQNAQKRHKIN